MKKECFPILLPTKTPTFPCLVIGTPELGLRWTDSKFGIEYAQYLHLYICSNEEIKEGDWILYNIHSNDSLGQYNNYDSRTLVCKYAPAVHQNIRYCKKVIATTDKELWSKTPMEVEGHFLNKPYPSIPQSFIQYYIEMYNKGNKLEKCWVEYEDKGYQKLMNPQVNNPTKHQYQWTEDIQLKLNGNEIIISNCEEKLSLTRGELEYFCKEAHFAGKSGRDLHEWLDGWLNKNS